MKLKLDDGGNAVLMDGRPVYTHDDGKDVPFDAAATIATIGRINGEAKGHREAKEAALARLSAFEGIDDPAAARKAMETVAALDAKKLIDAGEVERVRTEAVKAVEEKFSPVVRERDRLMVELHNERVGGSFSRSKFITDKLAVPADMVESMFGARFKIEGGAIVGYDASGNKLYSRERPGETAGFDEALEMMVGAYPHRDAILKASGASGSGAHGGAPGAGQRTGLKLATEMTSEEYAAARASAIRRK